MRRRWISFFCVLLLFAGGCSVGEDGEAALSHTEETAATESEAPKETVQLAVAVSSDWTEVLRGGIFENAAGKLEEWSDGTLSIRLYDRGQLGDDADLIQGVQLGTLNVINSVPASQIAAVPEAALLDAPGIFSSVEQYNWMMESGYLDVMQGYYQQAGLKLLDSYAVSFRQLSSSQPILSLEDFQGLHIRTMETPYHTAYWTALGAVAMPLPYSEVYFALLQGTVAAQENPLYNLISGRLYEVQEYLIQTNHAPMVTNYVMNLEQYEALSEEHQELLARFLEELKEEEIQRFPEEEASQLTQLSQEYGMEIVTPSEELLGQMREASTQMLDLLRGELGADVVDRFLEAVAAAETES